ncbi:tripartite tricarboxylate transporter permease [Geosporobacter ferrireducens]|uniref:Tat pathway signal protein n=1 Tax=Geosporobacter ferrireducens TaxID=1424294 RepID=A0A1D8GMH4_9FIRM|nr:tripartite tricarboxylate transporter permease [Geosporobacter ferrireducens]AOT72080.1 Tat pathway signal protein [Geosporobacter ferrireducens]MTI55964.1 tripartite tricarboxylate transporter permease [Geosporobacter ferrireducens]
MLADGFLMILSQPATLAIIFGTVVIGIIFGAIPGLSATMAIAMCLPITYGMSSINGIAAMIGLYIGGISGGLISAILLNMPGTPSSIATCFDGRPMALKGEAGKALGTGIVFSFLGTIISIFALVTIAPPLAEMAIKFGPFEYFSVTIFALSLIITLTGKSLVKGLMMGVFGIMLSTVGLAPVDNVARYTFGIIQFKSGFDILTVLVGLYAISEIFENANNTTVLNRSQIESNVKIKGFGFSMKEFTGQIVNLIRSTAIGIAIGILPGIGGGTSNILAYTAAKNQSREPEKFGTGIMDGVVASEAANNATVGGAIIPLLTLGIPGDSVTAMMLGGLIIHGITPGPLIFQQNGQMVYAIFAAMIVASIAMLITEFLGLRIFVKILRVPKHILLPLIFVLCAVGAFGLNSRVFDIWATLIFGIIGYLLLKFGFPLPPLILGFILGRTMEINLRRGLMYSNGDFLEFFRQPISLIFILLTVLSLLLSVRKLKKQKLEKYTY